MFSSDKKLDEKKLNHAVILAGGKGTRLLPYTIVIPKPMLPIGGVPIIEVILRQIKYYEISTVTISLGYMPEMIQSFVSKFTKNPDFPEIDFYVEQKPLGTSGSLKSINPNIDHFLVINGDILTTLDIKEFYQKHLESGSILTVAARQVAYSIPVGSLKVNEQNEVVDFEEKPTLEFLDNLGAYIYSRKALNYIGNDEKLDINELVKRLIRVGEKVMTYNVDGNYFWIDIGTHADYEKANLNFKEISSKMPYLSPVVDS